MPIVAHNAKFDKSFIEETLRRCDFNEMRNKYIDTLELSRKKVKGLINYKLQTLLEHFDTTADNTHRSIGDCNSTMLLYEKLRGMP
jgi:DNA polymerase III alpha subunit (gram-positive type)